MSMSKKYPHGEEGSVENVEVLYAVGEYDMRHLEGKLLTIVDASLSDHEQRKAVKDLIRSNLWEWGMNVPRRVEAKDAKYTFVPTPELLGEK